MIEFKPLGKDVLLIKDYLRQSKVNFCDYSVGVKFMWRDDFKIDYAIINDTLILRETCPDYKNGFYLPMGKDVDGALSEIEEYCKKTGERLFFCCVDNEGVVKLLKRYPCVKITADRNWSDYIYDAKAFSSFSGKKYSGQRNHITKFTKLYPDYSFNILTEKDLPKIKDFLSEYESKEDFSAWSKKEEEKKVYELACNLELLGQVGAYVQVNDKVVAFSIGEIVGETLIVHVEKGLKEYEGVYPLIANLFAKEFAKSVKYINREEDCGDMGLRTSKLQYHPIEVKEKNVVYVETPFDKITPPVNIPIGEIEITDILDSDKEEYKTLYTDSDINRFYGYDYKEDYKGKNPPPAEYFIGFMKGLKEKKEEYSLCIRKGGKMIGEVVLYNFGYLADAEIGFRLLKEYQGKGYATESVLAVINYLKNTLNVKTVKARAFKQNRKSIALLSRCNFEITGDNEKQYFFTREL